MSGDNRLIQNEADYVLALREIDTLQPGERRDGLVRTVEAWERKHWPIAAPDPVQAILFAMAQLGLGRRDLEPLIGSREKVVEVLNYKRPLSAGMIQRLQEKLGISAEVLNCRV